MCSPALILKLLYRLKIAFKDIKKKRSPKSAGPAFLLSDSPGEGKKEKRERSEKIVFA
jgi:hypothetical protein